MFIPNARWTVPATFSSVRTLPESVPSGWDEWNYALLMAFKGDALHDVERETTAYEDDRIAFRKVACLENVPGAGVDASLIDNHENHTAAVEI